MFHSPDHKLLETTSPSLATLGVIDEDDINASNVDNGLTKTRALKGPTPGEVQEKEVVSPSTDCRHKRFIDHAKNDDDQKTNLLNSSPVSPSVQTKVGMRQSVPASASGAISMSPLQAELRRFTSPAEELRRFMAAASAASTISSSKGFDGGVSSGILNSSTPLRRNSHRKSGGSQRNQRYGGTSSSYRSNIQSQTARSQSADDVVAAMLAQLGANQTWQSEGHISGAPASATDVPAKRTSERAPERASGEHGNILRQNTLKLILMNRMKKDGKMRSSKSSSKVGDGVSASFNGDNNGDQDEVSVVSSLGDGEDEDLDDDGSSPDRDKDFERSEEYMVALRTNQITWGIVAMMAFLAIGSSLMIGLLAPKQELNKMPAEFDLAVEKLFHHIGTVGGLNLNAMTWLSSSLTSYSEIVAEANANSTNGIYEGTWPYVTDPHYYINSVYTTSILSGVSSIIATPIVTEEQQSLWSSYSSDRNEVVQFRSKGKIELSTVMYYIDPNTGNSINASETAKLFYPIWQVSPSTNETMTDINFDFRSISSIGRALDYSVGSAEPVISPIVPATDTELNISKHITALKPVLNVLDGPYSVLAVPVFDDFHAEYKSSSLESEQKTISKERNVVGTVSSLFVWKSYFENVYRNSAATGILVVLDGSSCADGSFENDSLSNPPLYTFLINGDSVIYEGVGDLHHDAFSSYKRSATFSKLVNQHLKSNPSGIKENGAMLNEAFCQYTISVYPTAEFQNQFVSNVPVIFTATTVGIWCFVISVFILYGSYIQQQIRVLYEKASYNRYIVNKLFPLGVQERMRQVQELSEANKGKGPQPNDNAPTVHPTGLTKQINDDDDDEDALPGGNTNGSHLINETPPIADLFPSATVMFADIAGFTAWSSERNPVEVFTLLETLYNSFDTLAHRKRVFKVETIGDCYMCVTGLPEPREDHAVVMASFSYQCLRQTRRAVRQLANRLGNDVLSLTIRVGMHSGPVTAGVLRGEKARFQLFGDTVNTASRMESTGEKGKIQLSEVTAQELKKFGNDTWIAPRPGGVEAKGKGTVQTYWLLSSAIKQSTSRSNDTSNGNGKVLRRIGSEETFSLGEVAEDGDK